MQHLREVAELGQLPGPPHAGALWREALQMYRVWPVVHHQWEHAQVGEGGFRPVAAGCRGTESTVASGQSGDLPRGLRALGICVLGGEVRAGLAGSCLVSPVYLDGSLAVGSRSTWARSLALGDLQDETQSPSPSASCSFFVWVPEVGSPSDAEEASGSSRGALPSGKTVCICLPDSL